MYLPHSNESHSPYVAMTMVDCLHLKPKRPQVLKTDLFKIDKFTKVSRASVNERSLTRSVQHETPTPEFLNRCVTMGSSVCRWKLVCHEKMVCRDKEEKKNLPRSMPMHDMSLSIVSQPGNGDK